MLREEHNAEYSKWGIHREANEEVWTRYHRNEAGELFLAEHQYDPDCSRCWLGHPHTWKQHDQSIIAFREAQAEHQARMKAWRETGEWPRRI